MAILLNQLYEELKKVKTYLIKVGPGRRQGNILQTKLNEANVIFNQYSSWLVNFKKDISEGKLSSEDISIYENSCRKFDLLYKDIIQLCSDSVESKSCTKMDTFDLKTALTLMPVMTNDEASIKQLIDSIQYYDSLLKSSDCKKNLIKFVLKSRISQSAKLRLQDDYSNAETLVIDMKKQLLPSKGATAIQKKLHNIRQNDMTISDFGEEITELFVNLTIAQADGKSENYNVLKPINERQAIKQFSDGLRNRRLSTLIAARNFSSLKDAIQAAKDEETSSPSISGEVMGMYKRNYSTRHFNNNFRYNRGRYHHQASSHRGHSFRGRSQRVQRGWQPPTSRGRGQRGTYARGMYKPYRGNGSMNKNYVNIINEQETTAELEPKLDQFFRE